MNQEDIQTVSDAVVGAIQATLGRQLDQLETKVDRIAGELEQLRRTLDYGARPRIHEEVTHAIATAIGRPELADPLRKYRK